ncbi:MAG: ABC transporter permease [bacterium]|nr:ABC transporter permease [Gammaproteobacteria bacterium]HIL98650.1 ABC transporter permease [Pseudomonadales bacterium]
MNRALLVAQREFMENIRTRGFWIGILMMPVMLILIGLIPIIVESTREAKKFAVIDHSGWLLKTVQQQIASTDMMFYLREPVDANSRTPLDALKKALADLPDEKLQVISQYLVTTDASHSLDELDTFGAPQLATSVRRQIEDQRIDVNRWWQSLSIEDRSALSSGISTNSFLIDNNFSNEVEILNEAIHREDLFAYFIIGKDPVESSEGSRYISNNLTDRDLLNWFSNIVTRQIRQVRLQQENMDPVVASWINQAIVFDGLTISKDGSVEAVDSQDVVRQWAPVVFVYFLWISILINSQMLLTNTIEEKSNKLIEVLLSSISPIALMAGKIMGIAATGLTIIFSWGIMIFGFFVILPQLAGLKLPFNLSEVAADPWFLGSFLVYFLLGYLLYAAILVGLGSVCNNLKEAQNLMLPVQLVQMLPILLMVPIGRDPNGTLAQVLSYVPPLTPFVMMNRAAAPPTTTEYVLTTLLLLVSIVAALWVAAKIFRIGILLTGKPPGFLEILRWLKAPVTQSNLPVRSADTSAL